MKKIFILTIILITSFSSFAGWKNGMLRLKHAYGRSVSITIDGRKFGKIGRTITVGDLTPGNHRIKIYKYNSNGHGYANGILIYQGNMVVRPGRIYYCIVSNTGLDIEENCCIDDYGHWNNNDNWDNQEDYVKPSLQDEYRDENWNNNHNWNDDRDGNNYNDDSWNSYNGRMSDGGFNQLIAQVQKASFETAKQSVIKQALKTNRISCNQLLRLINELSFETSKLQLAKDAYPRVVDKKNYFVINDAFTFQSSKDELLEFLDRSGR